MIGDDDAEVLIALERVLESEGYRTFTAWTGEEALSALEMTEFDVMLIDEHLPEIEFKGFLCALSHKQPKAVRVMMSACKIEAALRHGPSKSVCKWEHREMTARIKNTLLRSA